MNGEQSYSVPANYNQICDCLEIQKAEEKLDEFFF